MIPRCGWVIEPHWYIASKQKLLAVINYIVPFPVLSYLVQFQ